jgi:DNA-binding beta-propeller fold protein YncE
MRTRVLSSVILLSCVIAAAAPDHALAGPRQSSPIAISPDQTLLVTVNPDVDTITIFKGLDKTKPTKAAEIAVGHDPVSVAIAPDNRAFVANALDGTVSVVDLVAREVVNTYDVGAEPAAVVLSPNATRLYVANAASNTVQMVDTDTQAILATRDVSPYGTAPRALAVTDDGDGDDDDETVFAALFYAQLRPGKTSVEEGQDDQREGRVVALDSAALAPSGSPNPVVLGPLANAGFNANGKLAPGPGQVPAVASTNPQTFTTPTGAFPNQLASIAIHPTLGHVYVVSTGASPNGPLRFNSNTQGLVSLFDGRIEVVSGQTDPNVRRTAPLNLNQGINLATTPAPRLFLSNPVAMAWRPDGSDAWIAIQNSDVLVRLTIDGTGIPTIGAPLVAGPSSIVRVDLQDRPKRKTLSEAPRGLVINDAGTRAFVMNFISRSVTVVDISNPTAPAIALNLAATKLPRKRTIADTALLGVSLFYTGRGPDGRMSSEGWGGCIACHPFGRSDNVTWMFDGGPRQTIALDSTFDHANPADQRVLNWSAVRDEIQDFELNTRNVFGGRGLINDDRLFYAIGGTAGTTPTDVKTFEQFQQVTGVVGITNDLARDKKLPNKKHVSLRRDFATATLSDGRIFVIGGRRGEGEGELVPTHTTLFEFDPLTNKLKKRNGEGFTLRHSLGAAAVDTSAGPRIYAIGGYGSTAADAAPLSTVEEYDPATDSWRTVASLPQAVAEFGITVAGGVNTAEPLQLIHVVSGNTGSDATPSLTTSNSVQRFQADPAGPGTWTAFNPVGLTLRRNHGAATAFRGVGSRVFVIGGQDGTGTVLDTVEEYVAHAVTIVATPHTSLPGPRARFGIGASLSTNQIYVAGGVDGTGADQTSVLEYTIATNGAVAGPPGTPSGAWVTRGNLGIGRHDLRLTTPNGVANFLPVENAGRDRNQDAIATWIALNVRSSHAPLLPTDSDVTAGRTLFGQTDVVVPGFSCATCHGGVKWTRSTVDFEPPPSPEIGLGFGDERVIGAELRQTATQGPNLGQFPGVLINVGTFTLGGGRVNEIRSNAADVSQAINPLGANGFNIPSLLSVHETAPYFYSGLAQTLEQVLDGSQDGNGGTRHHFVTDATNRAKLVAFLRSIDQTTPIFP